MSGKSKHGKRKQFRSSKKSKNLLRRDSVASAAPATATAPKPSAAVPAAPAAKATAPAAKVKADQYAYVPGDLRRIGALSGIIIVILFVLYFFLA